MPSPSTAPTSSIFSPRAALSAGLFPRLARGFAATLVVAVAAHVAFPLPFTPVPFTLQPLAVLCVGLFLGPADGALAMIAYLVEGAAGLPVFSPTGPGGLVQIFGPTGGFLLAYPCVAFLCGYSHKFASDLGPSLAAFTGCFLATAVLFASGAAWLGHLAHLGFQATWTAAVAPFLPGECVKILAAAGIFRALSSPNQAR